MSAYFKMKVYLKKNATKKNKIHKARFRAGFKLYRGPTL